MKSVDFIAYKQHLVRYLEEFIQDLHAARHRLGHSWNSFRRNRPHNFLNWSAAANWRSRGPSQNRNLAGKMNYFARCQGVWQSLCSIGLLETTLLPSRC